MSAQRQWQFFLCGWLCLWASSAPAAGIMHITLDHQHLSRAALVILAALAVGLVTFPLLRKLFRLSAPFFTSLLRLDEPSPALSSPGGPEIVQVHAEEDEFTKLAMELRAGPMPAFRLLPPTASPVPLRYPVPANDSTEGRPDQLSEFFAWAKDGVAAMQSVLKKAIPAETPAAQRDLLVELSDQLVAFKHRASLPELRSAWQLAISLEGLLKQLLRRESNITPSTLRTVGGGLELLTDLSSRGVPTDLATEPAIRILAVDDDPVSSFALSAALRKAFDEPDVAGSGETGLACAKAQQYDLIMLDVMMPGMDGTEVCAKIRENSLNRSTPVLFVTALKDFDTRLASLGIAGTDLMAKPFLTFEIAHKALTMVLRARLQNGRPVRETPPPPTQPQPILQADKDGAPTETTSAATDLLFGEDAPFHQVVPPSAAAAPVATSTPATSTPAAAAVTSAAAIPAVASTEESRKPEAAAAPRELDKEFLTFVATSVQEIKDQIAVIGRTGEGDARQEMLAQLELRLKSLAYTLGLTELRTASELCAALQALFKKLHENPKNVTDSVLQTATTALELVNDLCTPGVQPDLAGNPPVRILVVDDEPLSRRALISALPLSFSTPPCEASPLNAIVLAEESEFDLVFCDVAMLEMDGFMLCQRIHETKPNRATPVVFVTSDSDENLRVQSAECGGRDFVLKPFLFSEITVKALTYVLRHRLEKLKPTPVPDTTTE